MPEYLIAFNDEWVPDLTDEQGREASKAVRALRAEMKAAGILIYTNGLDDNGPVFSVDASSGTPLFKDGPFAESKEHLGGFGRRGRGRRGGCAAVGGKGRDGLRLAAGGASLPGSNATSGGFLAEAADHC